MYDGLYYGSVLICLACCVIDLLSGNFARAATAGTILFILFCIGVRAIARENREMKERIARYKEWYPGHPDAWYKYRIERSLDSPDIYYAQCKKEIEIMK